jgi:hypothetical protein
MPRLPPRNKRPSIPNPSAGRRPPTQGSRVYGWGQTPPGLARPYAGPSYVPPSVVPPTGTNPPSATPGTPGLPVDPIFSNDIGSAQRTHDITISGLLTQRANTASAYGYTPTYDEQGLIRSLSVDPNNPYAKANLLRKSYTENRARTLNSFASRGQLYAGALGVGQSINDENYQQGSNALQSAFINFIANNQGRINSTNTDYANALATADSARVGRASENDTGDYAATPDQAALRSQIKQTYAKPGPIPSPSSARRPAVKSRRIPRPGWGRR